MFCALLPSARARLSAQLREARAALEAPISGDRRVLLGPLCVDLLFTGARAAEIAQLADHALADGELMRRDVAIEADFALGALASLIIAGRLHEAKQHIEDGIAHARARIAVRVGAALRVPRDVVLAPG